MLNYNSDAIRERPLFLQTHEEPVYKSEFKPQMKVLARKPPPKIASRADASGAMSGLKLQDDEDSDEEDRKKAAREFEERKARAIREREEKQRKYQEAREKIFGSGNDDTKRPPSSGDASRNSSRGKGRGGKVEKESRGTGSNDQSPARLNHKKQLFDANEVQKESSPFAQRRANTESGRATPTEKKPIRAPRGPDGSAGFASKGFRSGDGV